MKTALAVLASLTVLGARPAARPAKLELQVITGSPEGFLVNSTLITGAREPRSRGATHAALSQPCARAARISRPSTSPTTTPITTSVLK